MIWAGRTANGGPCPVWVSAPGSASAEEAEQTRRARISRAVREATRGRLGHSERFAKHVSQTRAWGPAVRTDALVRLSSDACDEVEMLDRWERVVVMVQQASPVLVLGGPSKSLRVSLERLPRDKQEIAVGLLYAAVQLERLESRHRCDERLRLGEGVFEVALLARHHVEYC